MGILPNKRIKTPEHSFSYPVEFQRDLGARFEPHNRDFKMWYGEAVVRGQIVKITSGDVMTLVSLRLSRRSLAFYYGKVPSLTYSSLREYIACCLLLILTLFSLFEQPSSKIKYSIIKIRWKIIVSLSLYRKFERF